MRRLDCNLIGEDEKGQKMEIDALLDDVTELMVMEMKAAWLREDTILDESLRIIRRRPRRRRARAPQGGVAQFARIVKTITSGTWKGGDKDFSAAKL